MSSIRVALLTLLAIPAMLFAGTTAASATGQPHEVNDDRVIGHSWNILDARTSEAKPSAHIDFSYGAVMTGNDGCNDFWGHGSVNRETGIVTIRIEGMTRRMCFKAPEFDVYRLEGSNRYYLYGDRLTLVNALSGERATFGHR